jgi:hypothetical protein
VTVPRGHRKTEMMVVPMMTELIPIQWKQNKKINQEQFNPKHLKPLKGKLEKGGSSKEKRR